MGRIARIDAPGDNTDSPLELDEIKQLPPCDQADLLMGRLIHLDAEIKGTRERIVERAHGLWEMVSRGTHNPEVVAQRANDLKEDGYLYQIRVEQRRQTQNWLGELGIEDWR
jgi:hypothetical protein